MTQAFSTSPMARGLFQEERLDEKFPFKKKHAVHDHKGDKWTLKHDFVRNEKHPDYDEKDVDEEDHPRHRSVWHNERTGECHEGDMAVDTDGKGRRRDDYGGHFHISHYDEHKHKVHEGTGIPSIAATGAP